MDSSDARATARNQIVEVIRRALDQADKPLSVPQLRKQLTGPYRRSEEELKQILEDLVEDGAVYRFPGARKSQSFWTRDFDTLLEQRIIEKLRLGSERISKLKDSLKSILKGQPAGSFQNCIDRLELAGRVVVMPGFVGSNSKRLQLGNASGRDYIADVFEKVCKKLTKSGLTRSQIAADAQRYLDDVIESSALEPTAGEPSASATEPPVSIADSILDRMAIIEGHAAEGAPVPVAELRKACDFLSADKAVFDAALFELERKGRLTFHRHDLPSILTTEERRQMIEDAYGNVYNAISQRVS